MPHGPTWRPGDSDTTGLPSRKISETLLDFAQPLLQALPQPLQRKHLEEALTLAVTLWNLATAEQWGLGTSWTRVSRRALQAIPGPVREALLEQMLERKRVRFAVDRRFVGHFEVIDTEKGLTVRADAHLPRLRDEEG